MRSVVVALLCGVLWMAASAPAQGDEVDDLLAGIPAAKEKRVDSIPPASPSVKNKFAVPLDEVPLSQRAAWESTVVQPSHEKLAGHASPPVHRTLPPASVSLVPEPSAIALAALAMLYFLIFFRRRHLV